MEMGNPVVLLLLHVLDKGRGDGGVVLVEPSIVPAFPQECRQSLQGVRDWPLFDNGSVLWGDANSMGADLVSQVFGMIPRTTEPSQERSGGRRHERRPGLCGGCTGGSRHSREWTAVSSR